MRPQSFQPETGWAAFPNISVLWTETFENENSLVVSILFCFSSYINVRCPALCPCHRSYIKDTSHRWWSIQGIGGNYVFGSLLKLPALVCCAVWKAPRLHRCLETGSHSSQLVQWDLLLARQILSFDSISWISDEAVTTPTPASRIAPSMNL